MNQLQTGLYQALRALSQGQEIVLTLAWSESPAGPRKWLNLHVDRTGFPEVTHGSEDDTVALTEEGHTLVLANRQAQAHGP